MLIWDAHYLLHFCAIHAISSTSFWVGPLWFSVLHLIGYYFATGNCFWQLCHHHMSISVPSFQMEALQGFVQPETLAEENQVRVGTGILCVLSGLVTVYLCWRKNSYSVFIV